jgi:MoaA/NifB/PqqE/SkfB family radical SAM enzyme
MYSAAQPVVANVVVTRRCNLSCTYCNQYDQVSNPVPTAELKRRIDELARLGTLGITFTGGEPLMHPEIAELVRYARTRSRVVTVNTNGLLVTPKVIDAFNQAGLDYLWMSIDNLQPDEVSAKSLRTLDLKLRWLAERARFSVTINSVVGAGVRNPDDAFEIAKRARELGHHSTVGIVHEAGGHLVQLNQQNKDVYYKIQKLNQKTGIFGFAQYDSFQANLVRGVANDWHCVAGGRFLYICEEGKVHYCSQRRGEPGIPLEQYTTEMVLAEGARKKMCAPFCSINCVQQVSYLESFRQNPGAAIQAMIDRRKENDPSFETPAAVTLLRRLFADGKQSERWRRVAVHLFGLRKGAPQNARGASQRLTPLSH